MSKKITGEERVINYFMTEDIIKAETMLNTVSAIMNSRKPAKSSSRRPTRAKKATAPPEPITKAV